MKQETIMKSFIKYVAFSIAGMLGLSCYILADTFFVAKGLGTNGLAALNLAIPVYSFIHGIGLMIGMGGATKYTILKAEGEHKNTSIVFTHAIISGLLAGFFFLLTGLFLSSPLSHILGADNATFGMTNIYLKTILCFAPFFILNNILLAFIRNDGNPRLSMTAMLLGSFSNIILDYFFIFPLGLGIFGAALATGLAPIISICLLSTCFIKRKNKFHIRKCRFSLNLTGKICGLGTSSLITELSSGMVLILFNIIILNLEGNTGVAAYGIIANLSLVAISIFTGLAQGIQPLVSKNHGLGNHHNLKHVFRYAAMLSITIAVCLFLTVFLLSEPLVAVFNNENDAHLAALAVNGLPLYFTGFVFAGINIITASFFSSIEQPGRSFFISILRGFIAVIPIVLILSYVSGMKGVWLSFPCAEGITAAVAAAYLVYTPLLWDRGGL